MARKVWTGMAIAALVCASMAVTANAQGGAGGGGGGGGGGRGPGGGGRGPGGMFGGMGRQFEPAVNSEEMDQYAKMLSLNADQKDAAMALFEGFQTDFSAKAKAMRDKMDAVREEFRSSGDPSVWQDIQGDMEKFTTSSKKMEESFFTDFKALLTPEQTDRWPKVERLRTRERTIGMGLMSGERADVIKIVNGLELPADARTALDPTLDQYELDLDVQLQERNKAYEEGQAKMRELFQAGGFPDFESDEVKKIFEKGREVSTKVRDVNRRYARMVAESLPEEFRAKFDEQFRRESYPRIYGRGTADRFFENVKGLEGLDKSQSDSIAAIKESYDREMKTLNKEMESAIDESEANFSPAQMFGRGEEDSKLSDLRSRRRELTRSTTDKVRELLTEEQKAKLPATGGPQDEGDGAPRQRRMRDRNGGGGAPPPEQPRPVNSQNS